MTSILEYLEEKGFVSRRGINEELIGRLSRRALIDTARALVSMTPPEDQRDPGSLYRHSASISLGGGREDCCFVGCRRARLDHLARFAALYSDRVFIRNFFCDYEHWKRCPLDELRMSFSDDISLILHIQPLLRHGLITVVSEIDGLCFDCLAESAGFGSHGGGRLKKAQRELASEFLERTSAFAYKDENEIVIDVSGPKPYFEHGQIRSRGAIPPPLRKRPEVMRRLLKGERIHLSQGLIRKLGINEELADETVHPVLYHAVVNRYLNASLLTNREIEIAFLSRASGDTSIEKRNAIALRHLTTLVPFVGDVPIRSLDRLRRRERDSLLQFRGAFNRTIAEFRSQKGDFSAKIAAEMYRDLLAPELARLDEKVNKAKQDLITSATRSITAMVGAISFGLISGLIPSEVAQIAQAIGVASFGSKFIEKLMAIGDGEKAIQQEDFYFLWRVKKAAKARQRALSHGMPGATPDT